MAFTKSCHSTVWGERDDRDVDLGRDHRVVHDVVVEVPQGAVELLYRLSGHAAAGVQHQYYGAAFLAVGGELQRVLDWKAEGRAGPALGRQSSVICDVVIGAALPGRPRDCLVVA